MGEYTSITVNGIGRIGKDYLELFEPIYFHIFWFGQGVATLYLEILNPMEYELSGLYEAIGKRFVSPVSRIIRAPYAPPTAILALKPFISLIELLYSPCFPHPKDEEHFS